MLRTSPSNVLRTVALVVSTIAKVCLWSLFLLLETARSRCSSTTHDKTTPRSHCMVCTQHPLRKQVDERQWVRCECCQLYYECVISKSFLKLELDHNICSSSASTRPREMRRCRSLKIVWFRANTSAMMSTNQIRTLRCAQTTLKLFCLRICSEHFRLFRRIESQRGENASQMDGRRGGGVYARYVF